MTKDLLETLADGKEGFGRGAEKLDESDMASIAATFRKFSEQRGQFAAEPRQLAREYGDEVDSSGSIAATFHRGWMAIMDALTKDLSTTLRTVVERQAQEVRAAHDEVRRLRDSNQ